MVTRTQQWPSNLDQSPELSLFDCVCIIVGTIIGAGIFMTPTSVAANMPNAGWLLSVWSLGGGIAFVGALCFAELTTTYPDRGGDYGYLKRAYGGPVGFAFAWTAFWVIRPGNIGAMAIVFGQFATGFLPGTGFQLAALAVLLTSCLNMCGVQAGKVSQNVLAVVKVVGLLLILVAALLFRPVDPAPVGVAAIACEFSSKAVDVEIEEPSQSASGVAVDPEPAAVEKSNEWFWLSMVLVMFAFGGWNDIAFVARETKQPEKNLSLALLLGTGTVLVIYLLVNLALLHGLGFESLQGLAATENQNGPQVLATKSFGAMGGTILGVAVCVSCLGAISAMIFTSPRIYWAAANDDSRLQWLIGDQNQAWLAIAVQAFVTLGLMAAFSQTDQGFDAIVIACAPYFWLFLALTVSTLIVNRVRYRGKYAGFRVPFYPLPPLLFIGACGFMAFRSFGYMEFKQLHIQAAVIGGWVLLGLLIVFLLGWTRKSSDVEGQ
jgi:amino acid transporter